MTDNVIQELKQDKQDEQATKCLCGCGKIVADGKKYIQGHYHKHMKQMKTENKNQLDKQDEQTQEAQLIVTSFYPIESDPEYDRLAWYQVENPDGETEILPKEPVGIGLIEGRLYYMVAYSDGIVVPACMLPGFKGLFTREIIEKILKSEQEEEQPKPQPEPKIPDIKEDVPAVPVRVITPPPTAEPQPQKKDYANAPEQKKKSPSFLNTIFSKKEPNKSEKEEIGDMLKRIQESNAGKQTTG